MGEPIVIEAIGGTCWSFEFELKSYHLIIAETIWRHVKTTSQRSR